MSSPVMNWRNLVILAVLFKFGDNACSKQKREEPRGYSGDDYIVGGNDALSNAYPWMVYLLIGGKQQCGGSLISRHVVLTAAHCTDKNEDIKAYIGSNIKKEGQEYIVSLKLNHPGFDRNKKVHYASYDISLLYLKEKVLTAFPIPLINPEFQLPTGTTVRALGWGRIAYDIKGGSKLLQEVDLLVSPCTISEKQLVTETAFCTRTPNKDTCSGDSGSPVVIFENGKYFQWYSKRINPKHFTHSSLVGFVKHLPIQLIPLV
ncbi:chymase isoform X2 [Eurytemora carolleeae]|uniref:chymase isoform X2 n=1 Tax=Eurytemora carolleeae TaxID=1294199 RepID=UPI000C78CC29|nr:chymase isoform X2 [Eurytemora carolleeae]|eukprot:XP_023334769.1 chymase-like isoform X2 [Eurytemora affinis]